MVFERDLFESIGDAFLDKDCPVEIPGEEVRIADEGFIAVPLNLLQKFSLSF